MCCIRAQERAGKRQHCFSSSSPAWWDRMWGEDSDTAQKIAQRPFDSGLRASVLDFLSQVMGLSRKRSTVNFSVF